MISLEHSKRSTPLYIIILTCNVKGSHWIRGWAVGREAHAHILEESDYLEPSQVALFGSTHFV